MPSTSKNVVSMCHQQINQQPQRSNNKMSTHNNPSEIFQCDAIFTQERCTEIIL